MNAVAERLAALRQQNKKAFAPFVMAGYPTLANSQELLRGYAAAGADLMEVGLPFSDPLADGPVNQEAARVALAAGAEIKSIFGMIAATAPTLDCPLLLFSYFNPILQHGIPGFMQDAAAAGFAGLIVPDLPPEAAEELRAEAEKLRLGMAFLTAPTSPPARIRIAGRASTAFLYAVSVRGVTGERSSLPRDLPDFMKRIRENSECPVLIGFGISGPEQARQAAALADGVIVASALVRLAGQRGVEASCALAREIRAAMFSAV